MMLGLDVQNIVTSCFLMCLIFNELHFLCFESPGGVTCIFYLDKDLLTSTSYQISNPNLPNFVVHSLLNI